MGVEGDADDPELVGLMQQGDQDAFAALYARHGAAVLSFARRVGGAGGSPEDLLQETFFTLWTKRQHVAIAGTSLLPWLLLTCKFHAFNATRKRRHLPTVQLREADSVSVAAWAPDWIEVELARLPVIDRSVARLCLVEEYSYRDAAATLGITPAAVAKRLQRVRLRLRESVSRSDD